MLPGGLTFLLNEPETLGEFNDQIYPLEYHIKDFDWFESKDIRVDELSYIGV